MSDNPALFALRVKLRDLVNRHGSIGAAAKAIGCYRPDLSNALRGKPPRPSVLRAIGWEAVTTYRPITEPQPADVQAQLRDIQARITVILESQEAPCPRP